MAGSVIASWCKLEGAGDVLYIHFLLWEWRNLQKLATLTFRWLNFEILLAVDLDLHVFEKVPPQRVLNDLERAQTFLWSYDSAPRPFSPPPSPIGNLSLFLSFSVCRPSSLLTGKGGGRGAKIIRPSVNHTILSGTTYAPKIHNRESQKRSDC
jgi:hypothetical protein